MGEKKTVSEDFDLFLGQSNRSIKQKSQYNKYIFSKCVNEYIEKAKFLFKCSWNCKEIIS